MWRDRLRRRLRQRSRRAKQDTPRQNGAWPDNEHRSASNRATAAVRIEICRFQPWQRPSQCFEVVQQTDGFKSKCRLQNAAVDHPTAVGHPATIFFHRPRHAEYRCSDRPSCHVRGQEGRDCFNESPLLRHLDTRDRADLALVEQGEACVRAADVGEQNSIKAGQC